MKTAGRWKHGANPILIKTKETDYEFLHCENTLVTSRSITSFDALRIALRGLNTTSQPAGSSAKCSRTASRTSRFMRLRTTAFPWLRGTVNPIRRSSSPAPRRQNAVSQWDVTREPSSYTRRNSLDRRIRADFGKLKPRGPASSDLLCVADSAFVADGKLVAALGSTARQYGTSVLCFHAFAKAMHFGALTVVRLKRTFWHLVRS